MRQVCTKELLEEILKEGEAKLLEEPKKYNQRAVIRYECKCGKEATKRFEWLRENKNPYCSECTKDSMKKKQVTTCQKLYKVDNGAMTKESKEKQIATFTRIYGCHPMKTAEVQENSKKTCKERYGGASQPKCRRPGKIREIIL